MSEVIIVEKNQVEGSFFVVKKKTIISLLQHIPFSIQGICHLSDMRRWVCIVKLNADYVSRCCINLVEIKPLEVSSKRVDVVMLRLSEIDEGSVSGLLLDDVN